MDTSQSRGLKRKASQEVVIEIREPDGLMPVLCRLRPATTNRFIMATSNTEVVSLSLPEDKPGKGKGVKSETQRYRFGGGVFGESTSQEELHSAVSLPFVDKLFEKEGFAGLIMAYGASNSGKTYSTKGTSEDPGLIVRAAKTILDRIGPEQTMFDVQCSKWDTATMDTISPKSREGEHYEYALFMSFAEIYCEQVYDLLKSDDATEVNTSHLPIFDLSLIRKEDSNDPKRSTSVIKRDKHSRMYIDGQSEVRVRDFESAQRLVDDIRRTVNATNVNDKSSRSHLFAVMKVVRIPVSSDGSPLPKGITTGRIAVVDLAGAERIQQSGVEGRGHQETKDINKSLHTLSMCVEAMRDNQKKSTKRVVVPWRESKLTQLLQPYFDHGQARLLVHLNPDVDQAKVTAAVLRFAQSAGALFINPRAKVKGKLTPEEEAQVEKLRFTKKILSLEHQLEVVRSQMLDQEWEIRQKCNEEMQILLREAELQHKNRRERDRDGKEELMDQKLDLAGREIERLTRLLQERQAVSTPGIPVGKSSGSGPAKFRSSPMPASVSNSQDTIECARLRKENEAIRLEAATLRAALAKEQAEGERLRDLIASLQNGNEQPEDILTDAEELSGGNQPFPRAFDKRKKNEKGSAIAKTGGEPQTVNAFAPVNEANIWAKSDADGIGGWLKPFDGKSANLFKEPEKKKKRRSSADAKLKDSSNSFKVGEQTNVLGEGGKLKRRSTGQSSQPDSDLRDDMEGPVSNDLEEKAEIEEPRKRRKLRKPKAADMDEIMARNGEAGVGYTPIARKLKSR